MQQSKSLGHLPLVSSSSFNAEVPTNKLFQLIFSLTDNNKLQPLMILRGIVSQIVTQLKILKAQSRLSEITGICNKNDKLKTLSKVLRQDFFKCSNGREDNPSELESDLNEQMMIPKPPELNKQISSFTTQNAFKVQTKKSSHLRFDLSTSIPSPTLVEYQQYYLRIETIKLFYHLLVNEKMLTYLNNIHLPLYIYTIILGPEQTEDEKEKRLKEKPYIVRRQVEKGLKFIYQYVKTSKQYVPKIFGYLIKNLLLEYYPCAQDLRFSYSHRIKRINLCLDFLFETGIIILKKNLTLAAECGLLTTFYHKCLQGTLPMSKVELITEIIINYCIEERNRKIIHFNIDLDKTFAIFTNVDKADLRQEAPSNQFLQGRLSLTLVKNKDSVEACATMIEMYLSNWPTLLFFLKEGRTLSNFILSLKRKQQKELEIIQQIIFNRIAMRLLNYNRKKLIKSNNIFIIESNYLILRSLALLYYLDEMPQFRYGLSQVGTQLVYSRELIYESNRMSKFRECLIDIMLDYFSLRENQAKTTEATRYNLVGNAKSINYLKYTMASPHYQSGDDQCINSNIQSFCSESLLPFEFNIKELKEYLTTFTHIIRNDQDLIGKASLLLEELQEKENKRMALSVYDILNFFEVAQDSCKQIDWTADCLSISKYISNTTGYLLQMATGQQKLAIIDICRDYLKNIFHSDRENYFQYLNINLLDDIGRYFASDPELINEIKPKISSFEYAYKISRILLHIDTSFTTNVSTDVQEQIYSAICKWGSKPLILQVIEIIKYSFEQNDNIFRPEHLNNIFMLITQEDEDIVYSIIEFSEEYIHKSKELEKYIRGIDLKKIKQWQQRIHYLFLYYESTIRKIEETNPTLLKEELQLWLLNNEKNRKKLYYNFLSLEIKKFAKNSIEFEEYLNLNFDPNNYRKLIFLPWNIKINNNYYPIYIEYKNLEDKLKLKIFLNIEHITEVRIQDLYIGAHIYTDYIRPKATLDSEDNTTLRLTIEQIRKQHQQHLNRSDRFTIVKGQIHYFVVYDKKEKDYKIERININIPLTLDTYRPLVHPINFINLLCRTKYGYEFLKKEKFIDHCLDIIKHEEEEKYKDHLKGALVSIGTLCGSTFMDSRDKIDLYNLILAKFQKTTNHEIQEIYLWIVNILIKDPKIRTIKSNLYLIETKKCSWVCLPNFSQLQKETYSRQERTASKIAKVRQSLPERPLPMERCLTKDELLYRYFYDTLHGQVPLLSEQQKEMVYGQLQRGIVAKWVVQNLIKYISTIDFKPERIKIVMNCLSTYFATEFDNHFFLNKNDIENVLMLP